MDKIVSIYNKIRNSRWSIPGAVSVLSVCLIAVVTLFFCLPEAKAESVINTIWTATDGLNTYSMSDLANGDGNTVVKGSIDVQADNTYIIDGTGSAKTNFSIKLNYVGSQGTVDNPAKVYITLRNVEIERTLDYEMLALTTSSNPVQFVVTVEGQCKFTSRATGAENTPLISVENISYEVLKLSKVANSDNATYDDYVKETSIEREVGLILGGKDPEASLELYYGRGGSGAAIGSREAGTLVFASSSEANAIITNLNNQAIANEGQIYVKSAEIAQQLRDNGFVEYDYVGSNTFYPEYQYQNKHTTGAGSITIGGENGDKPLRLSIVNEGFGAAIGGGSGSQVGTSAPNASKITINGGTIYINSTRQDVAAIGTGVTLNQGVAAPSVEGIEINGGSIKIESAGLKFYKNPVNADGDRVYELKADTSTNGGGLTLSNLANLASGVDIPITYLYEPGLQFASNLENITLSATSDAPGYNILDVNVGKGFIDYVYQGTGHAGTSTDRSDMLYFYLPATETTSLTIKDEFGVGVGDGYTKFIVKDSLGNVVDPMSTDYSQSASRTYVLLKGETYYLSAEYIPNGLEIRQVTLNAGGVETNAGYSSVTGYTIPTSSTSVLATVVYGGTIDIQYSAGLVVGDEANHNITLPTVDYEYGTEVLTLPNLGTIMKDCPVGGSVTDLIFEGWMYTDASGTELGWITHITGKPKSGGSASDHYELFSDVMQSDGKIYLKAKWKIEINYVLGTGEVWSTGIG
ncbi:MAG: hypothetical protein IJV71_04255, partial [Lachnospiraceae bacterium]|nr:hypothetical protein [Lachnospiraceae bacterium]